jgi:hypothetical protein
MRPTPVLLLLSVLLAGCQSAAERRAAETGEIDVANASVEEVGRLIDAAQPKAAARPGMWKGQLRVEAVEMAGADPADQARQLEAARGMERETAECRTAEQLRPFEIEKLEKIAGECRFVRYRLAGGAVDAEIACRKDGAPLTTLIVRGRSGADRFDVMTENRTGTPGKPGHALIRLHSTGERIGACGAKL